MVEVQGNNRLTSGSPKYAASKKFNLQQKLTAELLLKESNSEFVRIKLVWGKQQ